MAYTGTFSITVYGEPRSESSVIIFVAQMHNRVLRIDEKAVLTERSFQRLSYTLIWTGTPKNMIAVSEAGMTISRIIEKYLTKWSYDIVIELVENAGG